jgi:hypothetical protein
MPNRTKNHGIVQSSQLNPTQENWIHAHPRVEPFGGFSNKVKGFNVSRKTAEKKAAVFLPMEK